MTVGPGETGATVGAELPPIARRVTQDDINRYAEASGGRAGIHIDPEYARRAGLGSTIAHGMMTLAYVDQMLARWLGPRWYRGGKLDLKFVAPVRPGDTVTTRGRVVETTPSTGISHVACEVWAENQNGERVVVGQASWHQCE